MTRYLPRIGLVVLFLALCLILQRNTPLVRPSTEISGEVSKPVFRGAPPVEERTDLVLLTEDIRRERQDVRWERPIPEAAFGDFREWARVYSTAPEESLRSKGRALAEARRRDLSDLIQTDPRRALELAVPRAVRRTLPPDIVALLEEPISGTGDLLVVAAVPMPGRERWVDPVQRFVQMKDGREFAAFTFGRRESVPSRNGIGVHGIALDGKLALAELPGRIMEPVEVAGARENETTATICPTSGLPSETDGDEVVVDWDGDMHSF